MAWPIRSPVSSAPSNVKVMLRHMAAQIRHLRDNAGGVASTSGRMSTGAGQIRVGRLMYDKNDQTMYLASGWIDIRLTLGSTP